MADKYYDPTATGADDGSSWANAWQTLQKAADNAVSGDTVWCSDGNAPETLLAKVDFDTNAGAATAPIKWIGVNPSTHADDGTLCVVDGDSTAPYCLDLLNAADYGVLRNFRLINATSAGIHVGASCVRWVIDNVECESNGSHGFWFGSSSISGYVVTRLRCNNNTNNGIVNMSESHIYECEAIGNGGYGMRSYNMSVFERCIAHGNGGRGIVMDQGTFPGGSIINCVIDGNGDNGVQFGANMWATVRMCRITNNGGWGIEIDATGGDYYEDLNVIVGNTLGQVTDPSSLLRRGGHSLETGADGYVDRAADNFTTATNAQLRREEYKPF